MSGKPAPKRKLKIRKPEKPIGLFMEEVSARNSETRQDELYLVSTANALPSAVIPVRPKR
jgi:hypothetical protein